jgi:predicted dehydrogenase
VQKVKSYIDSGELGEIYYIYMQRLNLGRVRQDINVVWNLAPHDISIILHWLGREPVAVSARGYVYLQEDLEDVAYISLDFADGVSAHIHVSWLDPNKVRRATVVGSEKMVVYDDVNTDAMVQVFDKGITKKNISADMGSYDSFGKFQMIHRAGDLEIPKIDFAEPLAVECGHFIDCIMEGKTPLSDGRNGLVGVRILEKVQESLAQSGKSIPLVG